MQASYASVITAGDAVKQRPPIPLENLPAGTFDPLYRFPLDVQSGELPVLPLSISGSVSMTHVPGTESFLSGDEWFIYKFDKQQVRPAGQRTFCACFSVLAAHNMQLCAPELHVHYRSLQSRLSFNVARVWVRVQD